MRTFRSIGIALALALGSMVSISAHAVEHVILRPLGSLFTESANTTAKFNADLAQAMAGREEVVVKVDSSLQRDGNGYRQDTAFRDSIVDAIRGNKQTIRHLLG